MAYNFKKYMYLKEGYSILLQIVEKEFKDVEFVNEQKETLKHGKIKSISIKTNCTIKIAKFENGNEFITEVELNLLVDSFNRASRWEYEKRKMIREAESAFFLKNKNNN